jgi:hypothetical protein
MFWFYNFCAFFFHFYTYYLCYLFEIADDKADFEEAGFYKVYDFITVNDLYYLWLLVGLYDDELGDKLYYREEANELLGGLILIFIA